jgi:hypothetical protein
MNCPVFFYQLKLQNGSAPTAMAARLQLGSLATIPALQSRRPLQQLQQRIAGGAFGWRVAAIGVLPPLQVLPVVGPGRDSRSSSLAICGLSFGGREANSPPNLLAGITKLT